jgi:hypothetical protein
MVSKVKLITIACEFLTACGCIQHILGRKGNNQHITCNLRWILDQLKENVLSLQKRSPKEVVNFLYL